MNTLLKIISSCDATTNGCGISNVGLNTTKINEDNQMMKSGVSQINLGFRFVFEAATTVTTALGGKTKMKPTNMLPMKYPIIG